MPNIMKINIFLLIWHMIPSLNNMYIYICNILSQNLQQCYGQNVTKNHLDKLFILLKPGVYELLNYCKCICLIKYFKKKKDYCDYAAMQ